MILACLYATFLLLRDLVGPIIISYLLTPCVKGIQHLKPPSAWSSVKPKRQGRKRERQPREPEESGEWEEMRAITSLNPQHFPQIEFSSHAEWERAQARTPTHGGPLALTSTELAQIHGHREFGRSTSALDMSPWLRGRLRTGREDMSMARQRGPDSSPFTRAARPRTMGDYT